MPELFETIWNSQSRYVIIFIAVIIIVYIPYMILRVRKTRGNAQNFLQKHPDAAKVIIKGAASGHFAPLKINDAPPILFNDGMKAAFYLAPGENIIEFQYTWTRPGVMHKTVTTTIGPSKVSVQAEPNKTYYISYDKKEEVCRFEES